MSGELDLEKLMATMSAELHEGVFVFATVKNGQMPTGVAPRMMFQENEGTTLILLKSEAEAAGLSFEFPSRMITLNVHSSLEAVGFIARIATELAAAGMGVNPVSAFYHDYLFIPDGRQDEAMTLLKAMAASR
ncbi:hypothetical protein RB2150_18212 [Rhodobacterales bacterium HTCC2150]|nr:hypothetical protein RB2150_18212 [Rhodobacterales bacterium HTCC2150] [Rhodobacteraceae bacterium HTCC2150]